MCAKLHYLLKKSVGNQSSFNRGKPLNWLQKVFFGSIVDFITIWNDYEVHDVDKLMSYGGNCLLVGYHSRCTVDLMYLFCFLQPNLLVTFLLFKVPIVSTLLPMLGIVPSKSKGFSQSQDVFVSTLSEGFKPLMLLPGGAWEAFQPSKYKYTAKWKENPGFARIICHEKLKLGNRTKVVPFHTKNCEDCYWSFTYLNEFLSSNGRNLYDQFKDGKLYVLPLMLTSFLFATGFFILPKRIKLDVYFGEPVVLKENETSKEFGLRVEKAVQNLIDNVEAMPIRDIKDTNPKLFIILLGIYTFIQNSIITLLIFILLWFLYPIGLLIYYLMKFLLKSEKKY